MAIRARRLIHLLFFGMLVSSGVCFTAAAGASDSRNALWEIVSDCLDPAASDYCIRCRWPLAGSPCSSNHTCWDTTEIWAETPVFVAIRDRKMCGCPQGFVHGLVIPRSRIAGVEDPQRPAGIWNFAWTVACQHIDNESVIALVVNPAGRRSQDQLHVHVVRLRGDARSRLDQLTVSHVQQLDEVWNAAQKCAVDADIQDYGVLVVRDLEKGFMVRVEKESPEEIYTERSCR